MRNIFKIMIVGYQLTGFYACEKASDGKGIVTVKVMYQNAGLPAASIYVKKGSVNDPGLPLNKYDTVLTADGNGQAKLKEVSPGLYYFYGQGYSSVANDTVRGSAGQTVLQRFRGENDYSVTIVAH